MMGKPVVAGTRVTVELILEKLAAGETVAQILEAHPRLTAEAVQEALSFAARALKSDVVYPTPVETNPSSSWPMKASSVRSSILSVIKGIRYFMLQKWNQGSLTRRSYPLRTTQTLSC
jgi:uncharacterized protein (DUF433 family)